MHDILTENVIKDNQRMNSKPTYFHEDNFKDRDQTENLDEIEVPSEVSTRGLRQGVFVCQDES